MANRRALLFAALALSFAASGAYLNFKWLDNRSTPVVLATQEALATVKIAVALGDLAAGEAIAVHDIDEIDWPSDFLPPGAFTDSISPVGRVPRRILNSGEPILEHTLLPEGSRGGLSPIITNGMRAVAVQVDEVVGIAGFVKPGSHVDVLATIRDRGGSGSTFAKLILQDIKVLAIDQSLEEKNTSLEARLVNVVTLEVSPKDAQKLIFAANEGHLQLALRNPTDDKDVSTSAIGASSLRGYRARTYRDRVQVIKGLSVRTENF